MVAVIGFGFGAAGTFGVFARPTTPPVGLIVALVAAAAVLLAVRLLADDRWSVIGAALGMYGAILLFSLRGPGGSVVMPNVWQSMVWMYGSALIILLVAAWPDMSRIRALGRPESDVTRA